VRGEDFALACRVRRLAGRYLFNAENAKRNSIKLRFATTARSATLNRDNQMALHPNFPTSPFIVRTADRMIWLVETKGRAELDLPQKMARLKQWCADATAAEENWQRYDFIFVDQTGFEKHAPKNFAALAASFTEFKHGQNGL
jgi:hypothetical protein